MPLYEYECPKCQKIQECMRSIGKREEGPECIECKTTMGKVTTKMNFKLLGRGWAADGYTTQRGHADLV